MSRVAGDRVRLGVIGAGFIAQVTHLHVYAGLPDCTLAAIADNRADLRAKVAEKFAIGRAVDSVADMLTADDVDAYVVVLPRRAMGPAVAAALATGKPVFAEKPMAHTLADGRRLVAAAEASGSPFAVGFMKRHDGGVLLFREQLRNLCENGELGAIRHVTMTDYCATYGVAIPEHFRSTAARPYRLEEWKTLPQGLPSEYCADYEYTLNVASHDINLLRFLFGDGLEAQSLRVRPGMQSARLTCGAFDIALDLGKVDTGRWDQSIDVYFERGRLSLDLPSPLDRDGIAGTATCARRAGRDRAAAGDEDLVLCDAGGAFPRRRSGSCDAARQRA